MFIQRDKLSVSELGCFQKLLSGDIFWRLNTNEWNVRGEQTLEGSEMRESEFLLDILKLYTNFLYPDVRIMISKKPWSFLYPNLAATLADYSGYPWLLLVWGEIWHFAACWKPSYAHGPMAPTSTIKVYCRGEGTAELQRSYLSLSPNINPLLAIFSHFYSQPYKTENIRDYTADYFDVRECEG